MGKPKSGWLDGINGHKETGYKNVVQKFLKIGGNSCGKPHSFDCAWVIVMMTKGFGRKWKNMKISTYFPVIDSAHAVVVIIFFAYKELLDVCFTRKLCMTVAIPKCVKLSLEITVNVLPIYVSGDL